MQTDSAVGKGYDSCLNGNKLYGDDFDLAQIKRWFEEEKEGYLESYYQEFQEKIYGLDALNTLTMYSYLEDKRFENVLGFGSSYGQEVGPIAHNIDKLVIVEPSQAFKREEIFGIPLEYRGANIDGILPCKDESFDLIVSFSVLHHVPNVSFVLSEFHRVLKPRGTLLIREPIVSMGDWRKPRLGLTKNERGIPLEVLEKMLEQKGFICINESLCSFAPLAAFVSKCMKRPYGNRFVVSLDMALSRLFRFNYSYHTETLWGKFRPTSVSCVLRK